MSSKLSSGRKVSIFTLPLLGIIFVFLIPCCFLAVALTIGGGIDKVTAEPMTGIVTDLYPMPVSENGALAYRVHIEFEDETVEVFNLVPSLAFNQMDLAGVYGNLHVDDEIDFTAVGFKLNGLGLYRNMVNPKPR